jgi:hypothetical protein
LRLVEEDIRCNREIRDRRIHTSRDFVAVRCGCIIHRLKIWCSVNLAGYGLSLQVRNREGSSKKADAQGIAQFFCCANAANGSEDKLVICAAWPSQSEPSQPEDAF